MEQVTTYQELHRARSCLVEPVGLVPTMGYLHEGHLSLVQAAQNECASVVVSIFVNPTQFSPSEDLDAYPRDLQRDLELLSAQGVDLVWTPTPELMYPQGFQTWITVEGISQPLEGKMRPGHFRGVTTVVAKLFNGVQPQKAYFGQKDAQQAAVIRRMAHDLNYPVEIVICPTVRETDGLAKSSRNKYLNPAERSAAGVLYQALRAALQAFTQGERQADRLRQVMLDVLASQPLVHPQYVSCAHPETLEELDGPVDQALLSMAVYVGKTRLIDNLTIGAVSKER